MNRIREGAFNICREMGVEYMDNYKDGTNDKVSDGNTDSDSL